MAEIDETDLCIVCNKSASTFYGDYSQEDESFTEPRLSTTARKSERLKLKNFKFEQSGDLVDLSKDKETNLFLLPQLRVVFLLKNIFKQSLVDNDGVLEVMQKLGDPSAWCEICQKCATLVDKGVEVVRKLKLYEEERRRIVSSLKANFSGSYNDGIAGQYVGVHAKTQFSKVRLNFRNRVRGLECAVKSEVPEPDEMPDSSHQDDWISNDDNADLDFPSNNHVDLDESQSSPDPIEISGTATKMETFPVEKTEQQQKDPEETIGDKKEILHEKKQHDERKTLQKRNTLSSNQQVRTQNPQPRWTRKRKRNHIKRRKMKLKRGNAASSWKPSRLERVEYYEITKPPPKLRGPGRPSLSQSFFEERPHEHLDMNLVPYPPLTAADDAKIVTRRRKKCTRQRDEGECTKRNDFPCPTCGKYFANKYYAISHIQRVHLGIEKPWRCNQCSYTSTKCRYLHFHLRDHKLGTLITCPICKNYSSRTKLTIDNHVLNHEKGKEAPKCHLCSKSFGRFSHYAKHMKEEHGFIYTVTNVVRTYVCEFCSATYNSQISFNFHKVKKHGEVDQSGKFPICTECGAVLLDKGQLEQHAARFHGRGSINYFCEHCGKGFALESLLIRHVRQCGSEPWRCDICGYASKAPSLNSHIGKRHPETIKMSREEINEYVKKQKEETPFKCKLCPQAFSFSNQLYHHHRKDHPEITDKFKCSECGRGFSRQCSVKRHYESAHLKLESKCENCGKVFFSRDGLNQHKKLVCKKETEPKLYYNGTFNSTTATLSDKQTQSIIHQATDLVEVSNTDVDVAPLTLQ